MRPVDKEIDRLPGLSPWLKSDAGYMGLAWELDLPC